MKLLIVDDEMQIRTGLEQGIDWKEQGFDQVYTARNGIEALDICEELHPEIIITDIRMPGLDGIELSRRVVSSYDLVEIIILSGYSDFEYAREALKIGAFDYLLKPINIEELLNQVTNAKKSLAEKKLKEQTHSAYQKLNKEKLLRQYLEGEQLADEVIVEAERYLDEILQKDIVIAAFSIDIIWKGNPRQILIYLNRYLQTMLKHYHGEILFNTESDLICYINILTSTEYDWKILKLKQELKELNKIMDNQFGTTVSVSLSNIEKGEEISKQYSQCKKLLKHRLYLGMGQLIEAKSVVIPRNIPISPIRPSELKEYIGMLDYNGVKEYLERIFIDFQKQQITSTEFIKGICLELKNILLSAIKEKGVDVESIFEHSQFILNEIPDYRTLEEYREWVYSIYYLILSGLSQLVGRSHGRVIIQAVDFISKNYTKGIGLEDVADYVNKSKNYFSYLFKKEMGTSFVDYLNQLRIEQAKKLLESTDELTYIISERVGFSDYKYFSSVFKKIVGVSPTQFRKG